MTKLNIFDHKWVNMVFEGRNQDYGAYVLRKKSNEYTIKGIIFAIIGFTLVIATPVIVNFIKANLPREKVVLLDDATKLEEPPPMDKDQPPPPDPPPPPPLKSTVKFTPPEIKPDEEVPDEPPPTQEKLKEIDAGEETVEGDPNAKEELNETDGQILMSADINPEFPGGESKMYEYLREHVEYPPAAKEAGVQGKVTIKFAVMPDGSIAQISFLKKIGWNCDESAEKAIKHMPRWTPGKQNGHPVAVWFILPVDFTLDE